MLLFTRPLPKLKVTAGAFEKAGIDAVGVATSDIVSIPSESSAASSYIASSFIQAIVVTSVYAVDATIRGLTMKASSCESMPTIIAVGEATARKLQHALRNTKGATVLTPDTHTSEGILAMQQLNEPSNQHVVIMKGEGGRDAIAKGLQQRGCDVSYFCVYKREQLTQPIYTKRWKISDVSGIIATSEAMATQLISHYGNALLTVQWLTVSERIATSLKEIGVTRVSVCPRATDQALTAWVKDNWEF
jgi:uroporphyrinogen-III synthase